MLELLKTRILGPQALVFVKIALVGPSRPYMLKMLETLNLALIGPSGPLCC